MFSVTWRPDFLCDVAELAEEFFAALADLLLETLGEVGTHQTDRGVHRMIAGAAIDAEPFDLLLQHPFEQFDLAAGMHAEIAHQVLLRLALPIALPAGVNDQDVAVLHLDRRRLDHGRRDHRPVVHMLARRRPPRRRRPGNPADTRPCRPCRRCHAWRRRCGCRRASAVSIRCATIILVCRFCA